MLSIWVLTVCGNVMLALILFARVQYIRHGYLTLSCIASVLCDAYLIHLRQTFPGAYMPHRQIVFWAFFGVNLMIIAEAWKWRERWIQFPVEVQALLQLIVPLLSKAGLLWTAYYLDSFSRVFNLGVIVWFILRFAEENHERTD